MQPEKKPQPKSPYQTPKLELHDQWTVLVGAPQSVPIQFLGFDEKNEN